MSQLRVSKAVHVSTKQSAEVIFHGRSRESGGCDAMYLSDGAGTMDLKAMAKNALFVT